MHPLVDSVLSPGSWWRVSTEKWKPDERDDWIIDRWNRIPNDISLGAAVFAFAHPLRKPDEGAFLRNQTLKLSCNVLSHWARQQSLQELLQAQKEYSVMLNDSTPSADRLRHHKYSGLDVPAVLRAARDVNLKMTAFGSTPLTLDGRFVIPTDDVDFVLDLKSQWDKFESFCKLLGVRPTWNNDDPSVDRARIEKATFVGAPGQIEFYHEPSVVRAYRGRRRNDVLFEDAFSQRTTIEITDSLRVRSLRWRSALLATSCVDLRPKDIPKAKYVDFLDRAFRKLELKYGPPLNWSTKPEHPDAINSSRTSASRNRGESEVSQILRATGPATPTDRGLVLEPVR